MHLVLLFFAAILFAACSHSHDHEDGDHEHTEQHDDHAGHDHDGHDHAADHDHDGHDHATEDTHGPTAAFTAAYVCPMHCKDSGSDAAGKCPVCGMNYVALEEHTKDGHKHE